MAAAKIRKDIKIRVIRETDAQKERLRQESISARITACVASIDVIRAGLRWRGSSMEIVGWGTRSLNRGKTEQSVLCKTELNNWAMVAVAEREGTAWVSSIQQVTPAAAREFLEPFPDTYTKLFPEPLLA